MEVFWCELRLGAPAHELLTQSPEPGACLRTDTELRSLAAVTSQSVLLSWDLLCSYLLWVLSSPELNSGCFSQMLCGDRASLLSSSPFKPLQLHHHEPSFLSATEGGRRQQRGEKLHPGVILIQTNSPFSFTSQFSFNLKCIEALPSSFWHSQAHTHRPTFGHRIKQQTLKLLCRVSSEAMC